MGYPTQATNDLLNANLGALPEVDKNSYPARTSGSDHLYKYNVLDDKNTEEQYRVGLYQCGCCTELNRPRDGQDYRGQIEDAAVKDLEEQWNQQKRDKQKEPLHVAVIGASPDSLEVPLFVAKLIRAGFRNICIHTICPQSVNARPNHFMWETHQYLKAWQHIFCNNIETTAQKTPKQAHFTIKDTDSSGETLNLTVEHHACLADQYFMKQDYSKTDLFLIEDLGNGVPKPEIPAANLKNGSMCYAIIQSHRHSGQAAPLCSLHQSTVRSREWHNKKLPLSPGNLIVKTQPAITTPPAITAPVITTPPETTATPPAITAPAITTAQKQGQQQQSILLPSLYLFLIVGCIITALYIAAVAISDIAYEEDLGGDANWHKDFYAELEMGSLDGQLREASAVGAVFGFSLAIIPAVAVGIRAIQQR